MSTFLIYSCNKLGNCYQGKPQNQTTKIIEPIRSRCILFRTSLPTKEQIFETILKISDQENLNISLEDYNEIINNCENKINNAIWFLELKKHGINYDDNWYLLIDNLVFMILDKKNYNNKKFFIVIKKVREIFYNLFITNISTQTIIRLIMIKLLKNIDNLKLKIDITEITSNFELRLSQGTRHIIHLEAYIMKLFYLFNMYNNGIDYNYDLD